MEMISIDFHEEVACNAPNNKPAAFVVTLPDALDEAVWEKLLIIKELTYPHLLIVAFSPAWLKKDLKEVLTRLAASFVTGISLKKSFDASLLTQINKANNLGLSLIK